MGGGYVLRLCMPPARRPVRIPRAGGARGGPWRAAAVGDCAASQSPRYRASATVSFWLGGGLRAAQPPAPPPPVCVRGLGPAPRRAVLEPGKARARAPLCVYVCMCVCDSVCQVTWVTQSLSLSSGRNCRAPADSSAGRRAGRGRGLRERWEPRDPDLDADRRGGRAALPPRAPVNLQTKPQFRNRLRAAGEEVWPPPGTPAAPGTAGRGSDEPGAGEAAAGGRGRRRGG